MGDCFWSGDFLFSFAGDVTEFDINKSEMDMSRNELMRRD